MFERDRGSVRSGGETRDPVILPDSRFRMQTLPDQFRGGVSERQTLRIRDSTNNVTHIIWQIERCSHHDDDSTIASIIVSGAPDFKLCTKLVLH
jgi:hypothetical protein